MAKFIKKLSAVAVCGAVCFAATVATGSGMIGMVIGVAAIGCFVDFLNS